MNSFSAAAAQFTGDSRAAILPSKSRRALLATSFGLVAAAAFLFGVFASSSQAHRYHHARGACIALEFAENFGALSATQKRQALRGIVSTPMPHQNLFPLTVTEFEDLCLRTWASNSQYVR